MLIKTLIRNKFHILLLLVAFIVSAFTFFNVKYNYQNKNQIVLENTSNLVFYNLKNRLTDSDLMNRGRSDYTPEYLSYSKEEILRTDYFLNLSKILDNIKNAYGRDEIEATNEREAVEAVPFDANAVLKSESDLISFFNETKNKSYQILNKNYIEFLSFRNENLKNRGMLPCDPNKLSLSLVLNEASSNLYGFFSYILVSLLATVILKESKFENYMSGKYKSIRFSKFLGTILFLLSFEILLFLFLSLFCILFSHGIGNLNYYHMNMKEVFPRMYFYRETAISRYLIHSTLFLIGSMFFISIVDFLRRIKLKDFLKYLIGATFSFVFFLNSFYVENFENAGVLSKLNPLNFSKIEFVSLISTTDVVVFEVILALSVVIYILSSSFHVTENHRAFSLTYKKPFEIRSYFLRSIPFLFVVMVSLLSFTTYNTINIENNRKSAEKYFYLNGISIENNVNNAKFSYEHAHENYNKTRGLTDEMRSKMPEDEREMHNRYEKMDMELFKNMYEDSKFRYILYMAEKNAESDVESFYKLYIENIEREEKEDLGNPYLKTEKYQPLTRESEKLFVKSLLDRKIPYKLGDRIIPFSPYEIKEYKELNDMFKFYRKLGMDTNGTSLSYLYNFFYLKFSLLLVILLPMFTNIFLNKKIHIEFLMNLPMDRKKIFKTMMIPSILPSIAIFIFSILYLVLIGLPNGFGRTDYPVMVYFNDSVAVISISKYILLNILLGILGMVFTSSVYSYFAINMKKYQAGIFSLVFLTIGTLFSYIFKFSFLLPFSYLDSSMVVSGFYRAYLKSDAYSLIGGVVVLILFTILFEVLSLKSLRRDRSYK